MIKVTIKLDKRRRLNNGKYPLKYKIARKDSAIYIATGFELEDKEWDAKNEKVKMLSSKNAINIKLGKKLIEINSKIQELQEQGKLRLVSNKKLLSLLTNEENNNDIKEHLFKTQCNNLISTKDNAGTLRIYKSAINAIKQYCDYDTLMLEDIDVTWIDNFVNHLKIKGNKENTIATRLRCIRTVITYARKRGKTKEDAFLNYSIKTEETIKRSLNAQQLRTLYNAKLSKIRSRHRDMFFLIFFLMGINLVDLSQLKEISEGRISYRRAKTGTYYNIKVEPEALTIINKYKGKEHLLAIFDKVKNYLYYERSLNSSLKLICKDLDLPKITVYWARHSFATIAYELGISMDVIADCLGHKSSHRITAIYVRKDIKKIDAANRKVIDYVLYDKKSK